MEQVISKPPIKKAWSLLILAERSTMWERARLALTHNAEDVIGHIKWRRGHLVACQHNHWGSIFGALFDGKLGQTTRMPSGAKVLGDRCVCREEALTLP